MRGGSKIAFANQAFKRRNTNIEGTRQQGHRRPLVHETPRPHIGRVPQGFRADRVWTGWMGYRAVFTSYMSGVVSVAPMPPCPFLTGPIRPTALWVREQIQTLPGR